VWGAPLFVLTLFRRCYCGCYCGCKPAAITTGTDSPSPPNPTGAKQATSAVRGKWIKCGLRVGRNVDLIHWWVN
jgi:hypothetical protein